MCVVFRKKHQQGDLKKPLGYIWLISVRLPWNSQKLPYQVWRRHCQQNVSYFSERLCSRWRREFCIVLLLSLCMDEGRSVEQIRREVQSTVRLAVGSLTFLILVSITHRLPEIQHEASHSSRQNLCNHHQPSPQESSGLHIFRSVFSNVKISEREESKSVHVFLTCIPVNARCVTQTCPERINRDVTRRCFLRRC